MKASHRDIAALDNIDSPAEPAFADHARNRGPVRLTRLRPRQNPDCPNSITSIFKHQVAPEEAVVTIKQDVPPQHR